MHDPNTTLLLAAAGLAGLAMLIAGTLAGWRGWLALKAQEFARRDGPVPSPQAGARIEIADLKERIRKLEAIAAGVEL
ncbi:hypothetical protein [Sphingomonas bacterium]|uniref:hypothetical protein n=1 Tax=Sphingomonas bacterium TaxID=1895847 RepID=UPI00157733C8|nr:hypothetical protein [Sphingomonas bacterium]